jgi:peptidoglycan hydrolase CwlO-like protein
MSRDSNPPITINTSRRFILTWSTAVSLIICIYIVSANYFEMRAADRDFAKSIESQEQRIKKLEDGQTTLVNKVDVVQNNVLWIRSYMEQQQKK